MSQFMFFIFFLMLPYLNIIRYDSYAHQLFLFGMPWHFSIPREILNSTSGMSSLVIAREFFLKAILPWILVLAFFPVMGLFFGRFFCGWLCPEGLLFEFADFLTIKILGRRSIYRRRFNDPEINKGRRWPYVVLAILFYTTVPPILGILLSAFFIPPDRVYASIMTGNFSFGLKSAAIGVSIYIIITSVFVRHLFCKYVCAAGLMQMLFGWFRRGSLRVAFLREQSSRCTDCRNCERVCFMDVKPRAPRKNINCVNCGECIIACRRELGADRGLFKFSFGDSLESYGNSNIPESSKVKAV